LERIPTITFGTLKEECGALTFLLSMEARANMDFMDRCGKIGSIIFGGNTDVHVVKLNMPA